MNYSRKDSGLAMAAAILLAVASCSGAKGSDSLIDLFDSGLDSGNQRDNISSLPLPPQSDDSDDCAPPLLDYSGSPSSWIVGRACCKEAFDLVHGSGSTGLCVSGHWTSMINPRIHGCPNSPSPALDSYRGECINDVDVRVWRNYRSHEGCTFVLLSPCLSGIAAFRDRPSDPEALAEYEPYCLKSFDQEEVFVFASVLPDAMPWHDLLRPPSDWAFSFSYHWLDSSYCWIVLGIRWKGSYWEVENRCRKEAVDRWCAESPANKSVCDQATWDGQMTEYVKRVPDSSLIDDGGGDRGMGRCRTKACPLSHPFDENNPYADPGCPQEKASDLDCKPVPPCPAETLQMLGLDTEHR